MFNRDCILVTGGAGFIGGNFIRQWLKEEDGRIINLDNLTYGRAGMTGFDEDLRHVFVKGDVCDTSLVGDVLARERPRAVINFAAQTHVDRSLDGSSDFVYTNVMGTHALLDEALRYWTDNGRPPNFRFLHVSTDEVYGDIEHGFAREDAPMRPNNPYSATKAGADCLVRAYHKSHSLPTLTTLSANNYGPYQFPDKLVPLMILSALDRKPLPLYGDGLQSRDWIYVDDNCQAIRTVLKKGKPGERYNIGTGEVRLNILVVKAICSEVDLLAKSPIWSEFLIEYVPDRPGHDRRYALNTAKLKNLGHQNLTYFDCGIRKTLKWYNENRPWCKEVLEGRYDGGRLGLSKTN